MTVVYVNASTKEPEKQHAYPLDKLPSKLKVWHKYAHKIIKVLYLKTPWLTILLNKSK